MKTTKHLLHRVIIKNYVCKQFSIVPNIHKYSSHDSYILTSKDGNFIIPFPTKDTTLGDGSALVSLKKLLLSLKRIREPVLEDN